MNVITKQQLFDRFTHKHVLSLSDLLEVMEEEFYTPLYIEEHGDDLMRQSEAKRQRQYRIHEKTPRYPSSATVER